MMEFDKEFMVPINAHVYYMNLTEANANMANQKADYNSKQKPMWKKQYDYLTEYNLKDLSPTSMQNFALKM